MLRRIRETIVRNIVAHLSSGPQGCSSRARSVFGAPPAAPRPLACPSAYNRHKVRFRWTLGGSVIISSRRLAVDRHEDVARRMGKGGIMLHKWLHRVIDLRERVPSRRAAEPEPYALTCICGETLQGIRRENGQRHICRHCGEAVFVFPLDVYPQPKAPRRRRRSRRVRRRPLVVAATSPTEAASGAAGTSPAQTPGADETSVTADRTDAPAASSASPRGRWRFHWYYLNPLWLARAGLRVVVRAARSGLWRLAGG
ncbi:MAG: hypothetical protein D6725_09360, partial [Planctomycetota bacterium]